VPGDELDVRRAERAYWAWHWGLPSRRRLHVGAPPGAPAVLVQLGTFVELELSNGERLLPSSGRVYLAADERGRNLYLVAQDGITVAGVQSSTISAVLYRTNKGDGTEVWRHAFEGRRPRLELRDGWPVIARAGSRYRVTWRGIVG